MKANEAGNMTVDRSELLPCPFCGEYPLVAGATIWCPNKNCWGPHLTQFATEADALAAWNRRASPTLPGDVVVEETVERIVQAIRPYTFRTLFLEEHRDLVRAAMIEAVPIPTPEGKVADADGWIDWKGGECPVDLDLPVDLRFRGGMEWIGEGVRAGRVSGWHHTKSTGDIIAYRIVPPSSERE